jgi:hypothetical protein
LRELDYLPFVPPNVAGFPDGVRTLGPTQLVHTFDLLLAYSSEPVVPHRVDDLFARFGLFGVSQRTRDVVTRERNRARRLALVLASPEYAVV